MGKNCCDHDSQENNSTPPLLNKNNGGALVYKVSGMDCPDEINAIRKALSIPGVKDIQANLMTETVTVYRESDVSESKIKKLIESTGVRINVESNSTLFQAYSKRIYLISTAGVLLGLALVLQWFTNIDESILNSIFIFTVFLSGLLIFPKAWRSLKTFQLDMNILMSVAVVGAIVIKEYSEAASVIFLFSLAEMLESLSVARARKAIQEVLKLVPQNVLLIKSSGEQILTDIKNVVIGDSILIRAGENIPVDGLIIEGQSSINQASLTGESIPVERKVGDKVFAGTLNELGTLKVKVEKDFNDTKISKIISLIEEAQNQKAPSQKFVDQFAKIYTPVIFVLAILIAVIPPVLFGASFDQWFYKALVFLVIGCPCALVIATPVSVVSGLTSLARRGVLVKGGVHLETLGKLKALALDKTGTITEGRPQVTALKLYSNITEYDAIKIAATLESISTHPLAKAVMHYAESKNVKIDSGLQNYKLIPGKGAQAEIGGHHYFVANHALVHSLGICSSDIEKYLQEVESKTQSVIILGHMPHNDCKGEVLAIFSAGDNIRPNVQGAIEELHKNGIRKVVLLSGDNQKTVDSVAKIVGIDYAKGNLLPEDKVVEIKNLVANQKYVGMVGDGVNDAPALAHSSIGIAMGAAGSDTAIETADVALMKDDISELPKAIVHGRRVLGIIKFNIIFALAIKAVFFVLAFAGYTNLWMAVMADMGASLIVTFNALRLLK